MKYEVNKGERALTAWVITNRTGVDKTNARVVAKVYESLDLDDVQGAVPLSELRGNESKVELLEAEAQWIIDQLQAAFDKSQVPANLSMYALSLDEKLRESLGQLEKEDEDESE